MLGICRGYDVAQARRILDLGEMLRRLVGGPNDEAQEGDPKGKTRQNGPAETAKKPRRSDAVSALKVVIQSVKLKFEEKSAAFEAMSAAAAATPSEEFSNRDFRSMCPMLNGSLDQFIPLWSGQQSAGSIRRAKRVALE